MFLVIGLPLLLSFGIGPRGQGENGSRPSTGKVVLRDGRTLETGLHEASVQAFLPRTNASDIVLVSGRSCTNCKAPIRLFVIDPDRPLPAFQQDTQAWQNAGELVDVRTDERYYEAQVFAGTVLPDTEGIIWYERSLMPTGEWRSNTTILRIKGEVVDTVTYFGHDKLSTTQALAFRGACKVIPGQVQQVMP